MDSIYLKEIVQAGISKLLDAKKPLSEKEIVAGIVKRLKKKLGDFDKRHTSKQRFQNVSFKTAIESSEWKNKISQISGPKYILKEQENNYVQITNDWNWKSEPLENAIVFKLNNLRKINPIKLEKLVEILLNKIFEGFNFQQTKKSKGDGGLDVFGLSIDENLNTAIYVQVKNHKSNISRDEADKFCSTISTFQLKGKYDKVIGLYIITTNFSKEFEERLRIEESQKDYFKFKVWNGVELAKKMLKHGLGITYSIDLEFWKNIDSATILKNSKNNIKKDTENFFLKNKINQLNDSECYSEIDYLKNKIASFKDLLELEENENELVYLKNKIQSFETLLKFEISENQ